MALAAHQIVSQRFAQSSQCIADSGLCDGQVTGSFGQTAFCHDFVEDPEQVQVEGSKIGLYRLNHFVCE
jgi:hypothetical protein